jgi:hypothetical protein
MADFEENSGYVRPERVNKWPNSLTYIYIYIYMMMEVPPVGAELFHAFGLIDRHDEANSHFSQYCECS